MRRWRLWLLMAPALALLLAIFAAPLLHYLWLSTKAQSVLTGLKPVPIGAQQWLRLWNDGRFWQDTWQTLRFSAASVSLEMLLGLAVALLLHVALGPAHHGDGPGLALDLQRSLWPHQPTLGRAGAGGHALSLQSERHLAGRGGR
jgi:hypothetical protein